MYSMRRLFTFALLLLALGSVSAMEASIDRDTYSPGEEGTITISLAVPAQYTRLILEVEILDNEGNLVYGDIMHSQIPEGIFDEPVMEHGP
jgi:hypothetical protein